MSFWDQNKDTFKKAGKATARGIGHGGKKLGQAGYTTYKKHEAKNRGEVYVPPSSDSDKIESAPQDPSPVAGRPAIAIPPQSQSSAPGDTPSTLTAMPPIDLERLNSYAPPPKRNVGAFAVPSRGEISAYASTPILAQPANPPQVPSQATSNAAPTYGSPNFAVQYPPVASNAQYPSADSIVQDPASAPNSQYNPGTPAGWYPTSQDHEENSILAPPPAYPAQATSPLGVDATALPHAGSGNPHKLPPALPLRNVAYNAPIPSNVQAHASITPPPPPPRSHLTASPPQMSLATKMVLGAISSSANVVAQSFASQYAPPPASQADPLPAASNPRVETPAIQSRFADAAAQSFVNHAQANYKTYLSAAAAGVSSSTSTATTASSPDQSFKNPVPLPPQSPQENPVPQLAQIDLNEKPALMARNYARRPEVPAASSSPSLGNNSSVPLIKKAPPPKPAKKSLQGSSLNTAIKADTSGPMPNFAEQIASMRTDPRKQKPLVPPKKFPPPKPANRSLAIVLPVQDGWTGNLPERTLNESASWKESSGKLQFQGDLQIHGFHDNSIQDSGNNFYNIPKSDEQDSQTGFVFLNSSLGRLDESLYNLPEFRNAFDDVDAALNQGRGTLKDLLSSHEVDALDFNDPDLTYQLDNPRSGRMQSLRSPKSGLGGTSSKQSKEKSSADYDQIMRGLNLTTGWFINPTFENIPKFLKATEFMGRLLAFQNIGKAIVRIRSLETDIYEFTFVWRGLDYQKPKVYVKYKLWYEIPVPTDSELVQYSRQFGPQVAAKAFNYTGSIVGNGQCWTLAVHCLKFCCGGDAMDTVGVHHGWPILVRGRSPWLRDPAPDRDQVRVGDIIQYYEAKFKYPGGVLQLGAPHHTAVIVGVKGKVLTLRHSNVGGDLRTQHGSLNLDDYVLGMFAIFRPLPKNYLGNTFEPLP